MKEYYGISLGVVLLLIFLVFRLIYQNYDYSQDTNYKKSEVDKMVENYIEGTTTNNTTTQEGTIDTLTQGNIQNLFNEGNIDIEITEKNIDFICDIFLSNRNSSCDSNSSYNTKLREDLFKILGSNQNIVAVSKSQIFDGPSYKVLYERSFLGYTNTPELDVVEGCNEDLRYYEFNYEDCVVVIKNSFVVDEDVKNRIIILQTNN